MNHTPPSEVPAPSTDASSADDDATWNFEVRPKCDKCYRLAVTYDPDETPLCARHATIFLTAEKHTASGAEPEAV